MSNNYIPRYLPFHNWDEWISVKEGLYSLNPTHRDRAIQIVELWRSRGRVPHSVDSTAQVVEALSCSGWRSDMESRLMYSTIIIRAVNGLVDSGQQGHFAESILKIAEQIGLPGWIVDVRYDATHNQLPTLAVLRVAANKLLDWFYYNYWIPQHDLLLELTNICLPSDMASTELKQSNPPKVFESYVEESSPTFLCNLFLPAFFLSLETVDPPIEYGILKKRKTHWLSLLTKLLTSRPIYMHALLCNMLSLLLQYNNNINSGNTKSINFNDVLFWSNEIMKLLIQLFGVKTATTIAQQNKSDSSKGSDSDVLSQLSLYYSFITTILDQYPTPTIPSVCKAVEDIKSIYLLNKPTDANISNIGTVTFDVYKSSLKRSSSEVSMGGKTPASNKKLKTVANTVNIIKYSEICNTYSNSNCGTIGSCIGVCEDFPVWPLGLLPGQTDSSALLLLDCVDTKQIV